jgi:amidase
MPFQLPDANDLKRLAAEMDYQLDDETAATMLQYLAPFGDSYIYLDQTDDELPPVRFPERSHYFPAADENRLGAWYVKTAIKGRDSGPLRGKTIAIKDNIFIADVPMMNGADILEGLVPDFDASVVTRLLEAGADIRGKAVCEYFCTSGGSATASTGIVDNPRRSGYTAGGSSSGSAALVGGGDVDVALGCDQAGSIRIPSSFSGTCGMKPTHGLVPYTGIIGMEAMLDHVGPITAGIEDNALTLEVLAGYDGLDSRQRELQTHRYTDALGRDIKGMKIGVVREGFGHPLSEPDVDECVREAADRLAALGAQVEDVSIPMHPKGVAVWGGVITDGLWETLRLNGQGYNVDTVYSPALHRAMEGWQAKQDQFPINVKMLVLLGKHLEQYNGWYYGKARNLVRRLRRAYDSVLQDRDLLLMPTTVQKASKNPKTQAELTPDQIITLAFNTLLNTCQFNISGHPAMSIPCGLRDRLPVGMMLVARHFNEPAIYRAAHAFERTGDWQTY